MALPPKLARPGTTLLVGGVIAATTIVTVFVLPFHLSGTVPVQSQAYAAGASNKIAEIGAALLSLAVLAYTLGRTRSQPRPPDPQLQRAWLYSGLAIAAVLTLALGAAVVRAQVFFGESEYFINQLEMGLRLHRTLYTQVQFAYGPLLYGWAALVIRALAHFGVGVYAAYVAALVLMQLAGFALLYYVVNALPFATDHPLRLFGSLRAFAYSALALGSLSPTLGLNYSLFRFAAPMAAMVLLVHQETLLRAIVTAALAVAAGFAVSPEAGTAALGGALAYTVLRTWLSGLRWVAVALGGLIGAALFAIIAGPQYFLTLRDAGSGGYDILLTPEPRTLYFLVAVIALAPIAVARFTNAARRQAAFLPQAGILVALYGVALGCLPVALGRCDAVHEYFCGLAATLLSLVALDQLRSLPARLWIAAVVASVAITHYATFHLYQPSLAALHQRLRTPVSEGIDLPSLEQALAGAPVFLVDGLPYRSQQQLFDRNLVAPTFYFSTSDIWRAEAEQRKIAEMRQATFALAPRDGMANPSQFYDGSLNRWRHLGIVYRQRREPFEPGLLLDQELKQNWLPLHDYAGYILYRRAR